MYSMLSLREDVITGFSSPCNLPENLSAKLMQLWKRKNCVFLSRKNLCVVWLHHWLHHSGQVTYVWTSTSQNIRSRGPSPFLGHLVLHFCDTKDFEGIRDGRAIAARLAIAGPTFPESHRNHFSFRHFAKQMIITRNHLALSQRI